MAQSRSKEAEGFIRRAVPADSEGILGCLQLAFEPFKSQYTPQAYLDTVLQQDSLAERLLNLSVFVAVSPDGDVIGTISCSAVSTREGHLRGMAVLPSWQGRGLAKRLLDRAILELLDKGCEVVTLGTTEPLKRAISFYERHGFRATGKTADFFGMPLFEYKNTI